MTPGSGVTGAGLVTGIETPHLGGVNIVQGHGLLDIQGGHIHRSIIQCLESYVVALSAVSNGEPLGQTVNWNLN